MPADAINIRLLREADLPDYKRLRDLMLARHPSVFTSDAETELLRAAESYRSRLGLSNGGGDRQLLDESLRLLKSESGLMRATLSVTATNATAIRLYERVGFSRYGRLEGALKLADGSLLDKDLMSRTL